MHTAQKDVAVALGDTNPQKALIDHVDDEDKGVTKCYALGGVQELTIINESGFSQQVGKDTYIPEAACIH